MNDALKKNKVIFAMKPLIEEFISFSDLECQSLSQVQGKITHIQTPIVKCHRGYPRVPALCAPI
jgi:hypothetical protein